MYLDYHETNSGASFIFADQDGMSRAFKEAERHLKFIWNTGKEPFQLEVDDAKVLVEPNHILCCTYLQQLNINAEEGELAVLFFNREFYCVHTQDKETSCNGLLFFGSQYTPILKLEDEETEILKILIKVLSVEFTIKDANQEEMLRILLKRFIIRCTRLARLQLLETSGDEQEIDLVRQFNVLVEEHFWTKKTVGEYADLLFKSPKTIGNLFSMYTQTTPLQVIHERVILEAKRMLLFTELSIKEIGSKLGYEDTAQFSKFFKKQAGQTPKEFQLKREGFRI